MLHVATCSCRHLLIRDMLRHVLFRPLFLLVEPRSM